VQIELERDSMQRRIAVVSDEFARVQEVLVTEKTKRRALRRAMFERLIREDPLQLPQTVT
jgi:hypothetical protein